MFVPNSQQESKFIAHRLNIFFFKHTVSIHSCLLLALVNTPAAGGEDYDGPSTALERGLHSSNGCDLCRVRGEGSEATQLLKQLLVENGCLCLPADLSKGVGDTEGGEGYQRALCQV